ncbi:AAA family ATPase [Vibrio splendidus]|uniref:AAA family ATPase n=1 Tax=Vibrio splendidus TaxID=29497 RepID=UPI0024688C42|nr:AAA family ATPase [Vibrio splendidus]MDH5914451.1 AAA family ATPase [Vibrio splendidus]MDH5943520.1 AAA family ATPase [Vibrio splendidus]MDH5985145.1 AAA family ATPase [Vibrio splendidus]MDH5995269.1 AAA family ATPase [Vibrio splendidus]MDH6006738.1 AAA family ATPase [Vibrio splendidus]
MYIKQAQSLDEMLLSDSNKKQLEIIAKMKGFFLIHSKSTGSGKSLAARIVADSISDSALFIDASCAKSAKQIDSLDRKLAMHDLSNCSPVVVIDEIDKLNSQKLQAISSAYNKFSTHTDCVVIMTANAIDRIPANLLSRVNGIDFNQADNEELVIAKIAEVVDKEIEDEQLNSKFMQIIRIIISASSGDIRKVFAYTEKYLLTREIDKNPLIASGY